MTDFLIAQNDDPELLEWLAKAEKDGGGFAKAIAQAGLNADSENYPLVRPVLVAMRKKYPAYEPSDAVKQEVRQDLTPEEHQAEHVRLHRALDELLACYLSQRRIPRTSIHDEIFELMKWAHEMTLRPSPTPEESGGTTA
jgi:hypothetical protein